MVAERATAGGWWPSRVHFPHTTVDDRAAGTAAGTTWYNSVNMCLVIDGPGLPSTAGSDSLSEGYYECLVTYVGC